MQNEYQLLGVWDNGLNSDTKHWESAARGEKSPTFYSQTKIVKSANFFLEQNKKAQSQY